MTYSRHYRNRRRNPTKKEEYVAIFDGLQYGGTVFAHLKGVMGGNTGGLTEFKVGKKSHSKKYNVYSITLLPMDGSKPSQMSKYTLRKRKYAGEEPYVSAAIGDMGISIEALKAGSPPAKKGKKAPAKATYMEVGQFKDAIQAAVKAHFPDGYFYFKTSKGQYGKGTIYIATATLPKGAQANGIIQNDPSYNTFWMHDSFTPDSEADWGGVMDPKIKVEMSQGNTLYGPNATDPQKVGWKNSTAARATIIKKFETYYAKLAAMVAAKGGKVAKKGMYTGPSASTKAPKMVYTSMPSQTDVVVYLSQQPGFVKPAQVANALGHTEASVQKTLDLLTQNGAIQWEIIGGKYGLSASMKKKFQAAAASDKVAAPDKAPSEKVSEKTYGPSPMEERRNNTVGFLKKMGFSAQVFSSSNTFNAGGYSFTLHGDQWLSGPPGFTDVVKKQTDKSDQSNLTFKGGTDIRIHKSSIPGEVEAALVGAYINALQGTPKAKPVNAPPTQSSGVLAMSYTLRLYKEEGVELKPAGSLGPYKTHRAASIDALTFLLQAGVKRSDIETKGNKNKPTGYEGPGKGGTLIVKIAASKKKIPAFQNPRRNGSKWALSKTVGFDAVVLSLHATRAAAQKAYDKKYDYGMMGPTVRILEVGPNAPSEIIKIFGKRVIRPRTNPRRNRRW